MKPIHLIAQVVSGRRAWRGLNSPSRGLSRASVPRQVARRIDQSPPITDLFVGNSLMEAGFEAEPFERPPRPPRPEHRAGL